MAETERITLLGGYLSPYTRKMPALLRYRHIRYRIHWINPTDLFERKAGALRE